MMGAERGSEMTREDYIKITEPLRKNPKRTKRVVLTNRILTGIVYVIYPLLLALLLIQRNPFLLRAVLVPGISFVAVSVFRRIYNAPRPYERFNMPPVLNKDSRGQSFPSRHVFSVFVIAMTFFYINPSMGIMLFVVGAGIAAIRVIGGVHEPRDVIAGTLVGILCGIVGYYLI